MWHLLFSMHGGPTHNEILSCFSMCFANTLVVPPSHSVATQRDHHVNGQSMLCLCIEHLHIVCCKNLFCLSLSLGVVRVTRTCPIMLIWAISICCHLRIGWHYISVLTVSSYTDRWQKPSMAQEALSCLTSSY